MMFGTQLSKEESFHQLDRTYEGGVTFFDMAEIYSVPPSAEVQGLAKGYWANGSTIMARATRSCLQARWSDAPH